MLIDVGLFIAVAVVSRLVGIPLGAGLVLTGLIIVITPFMGSHAAPTSYGISSDAAAHNELRQGLERAQKRATMSLFNPFVWVGLPLMIIGGALLALMQ